MSFNGRVALVTGAGKGLGRAYALWLAQRGAKVAVNNRRQSNNTSSAEAVVEEIRRLGGEAIAVEGSVEVESDAGKMVAVAIEAFGGLDILICNAGISPAGTLAKIPMDLFRQVVEVNLYGTVYPVRAALPHMRSAGYGRMVLTSSASAYCGAHGLSAYAAAKAGVIGLARSLVTETTKFDIKTNVISPLAYTPMTTPFMDSALREEMSPNLVAPMVGWLASDSCTLNGAVIEGGGGRFRRVVFGPCDKIAEGQDPGQFADKLELPAGVAEVSGAATAADSMFPEREE